MLSERRNYGRIRINPFGQLGSLSVHFPVDELPERAAVGFISNGQHQGYAINPFSAGTLSNGLWGYCNLLDAKAYGLYDRNYNQPMSIMSPYKVVYIWVRVS